MAKTLLSNNVPDWFDFREGGTEVLATPIIVREEDNGTWSVVRTLAGKEADLDSGYPTKEAAYRIALTGDEGAGIVVQARKSTVIKRAGIHTGMLAKYGETPVTIIGIEGNDVEVLTQKGEQFYTDITQLANIKEAKGDLLSLEDRRQAVVDKYNARVNMLRSEYEAQGITDNNEILSMLQQDEELLDLERNLQDMISAENTDMWGSEQRKVDPAFGSDTSPIYPSEEREARLKIAKEADESASTKDVADAFSFGDSNQPLPREGTIYNDDGSIWAYMDENNRRILKSSGGFWVYEDDGTDAPSPELAGLAAGREVPTCKKCGKPHWPFQKCDQAGKKPESKDIPKKEDLSLKDMDMGKCCPHCGKDMEEDEEGMKCMYCGFSKGNEEMREGPPVDFAVMSSQPGESLHPKGASLSVKGILKTLKIPTRVSKDNRLWIKAADRVEYNPQNETFRVFDTSSKPLSEVMNRMESEKWIAENYPIGRETIGSLLHKAAYPPGTSVELPARSEESEEEGDNYTPAENLSLFPEQVAPISPAISQAMRKQGILRIAIRKLAEILIEADNDTDTIKVAKEVPTCKKCGKPHWPFQKCDQAGKKPESKEVPVTKSQEPDEKLTTAQVAKYSPAIAKRMIDLGIKAITASKLLAILREADGEAEEVDMSAGLEEDEIEDTVEDDITEDVIDLEKDIEDILQDLDEEDMIEDEESDEDEMQLGPDSPEEVDDFEFGPDTDDESEDAYTDNTGRRVVYRDNQWIYEDTGDQAPAPGASPQSPLFGEETSELDELPFSTAKKEKCTKCKKEPCTCKEKEAGKVTMRFDWPEFFNDVLPQLSNREFQSTFNDTISNSPEVTASQEEQDLYKEELDKFGKEASRRGLPNPLSLEYNIYDKVITTVNPKIAGTITEYRKDKDGIKYLIASKNNELWFSGKEITAAESNDEPMYERTYKITEPENSTQDKEFNKDLSQKTGSEVS